VADHVLAAALLDRLLHVSTTLNIRGHSYRLREKRRLASSTISRRPLLWR
jgi:DNA replication protein DnaC